MTASANLIGRPPLQSAGAAALAHPAYLGTFHKTGSRMMRRILQDFCASAELKLWLSPPAYWARGEGREPAAGWDICFENHSRFLHSDAPRRPNSRAAIVIRDPRDVIISGAHYHVWSDEEWLHNPRPDLDGVTYHTAINALSSERERMLFELNHAGRNTIGQMLAAQTDDPSVRVFKYEDLVSADRNAVFWEMFAFLGAPERFKEPLETAIRENTLEKQTGRDRHIRSGAPEQWRSVFDDELQDAFLKVFPRALERLGYPPF